MSSLERGRPIARAKVGNTEAVNVYARRYYALGFCPLNNIVAATRQAHLIGFRFLLPFWRDSAMLGSGTMNLPPWLYLVLFAVSVFAGLVDAIAGGGGLIIMPALLACGFPPPLAMGTKKLGAICGTSPPPRHYAQQGLVDWKSCRLGFFTTL